MDADRQVAKLADVRLPSDAVIDFIAGWESCHLEVRRDPLNPHVCDIGFGHVCAPDHPPLRDRADAIALLRFDVFEVAAGVRREVTIYVTQCQFDALVSFAYNVGLDEDDDGIAEGLGDSTLLRYVELGRFAQAAAQFELWDKAQGKAVPGLHKRRVAEAAMFTRGDYSGRP